MTFTIFADGGSRGNPGPAGAGAVVLDADSNVIMEISEYLGITTNNVAEYTGVLHALNALIQKLGAHASSARVSVYMDSMLVVKQMNGEYKIKHPNLIPLAREVALLVKKFAHVSFAHVYREKNKEADRLANDAMDKGMNRH